MFYLYLTYLDIVIKTKLTSFTLTYLNWLTRLNYLELR